MQHLFVSKWHLVEMHIADVVVELDTSPQIVKIIDDFYLITTLINNNQISVIAEASQCLRSLNTWGFCK